MRVGFFLREALRAMRRSAAPSFAALITVLVTMLVLGVFIPIVQAADSTANSVRNRVEVEVYVKSSATTADESRVRNELVGLPHVKRVEFISKQQAYAQQSKQDPAAYALLSANPLPDTFQLIPDNPGNVLLVRNEVQPPTVGGAAKLIDGSIQNVSNHVTDTKKLLGATNLVTWIGLVLGILLVIASVMLIGNTIRLSLYARRREVEVMKLVGATDWFIRWPFVIEGVLVGAAGAMLALVVLAVTKLALLDPLANNWTLIAAPRTIPFVSLVAVLLGAGVGVSALGSGLSLRRFLRV
ncbi:MAG TPA: permease-like cell division protein FtsX [Solirubrobacteraceae bacterium]|jgi:cell division transport system permease protein|nr:permease-like cell division protein FtsX [Solirubrobacteraceae bacterium]